MKPTSKPATRKPATKIQRVNVDFPLAILERIDTEADRMGVNRQAWIKFHLAAALDARDATTR